MVITGSLYVGIRAVNSNPNRNKLRRISYTRR